MLFNSVQFAIFLPIVFFLYWFAFDRFIAKSKHQLALQNAFVVVASYVFYGWWDWRFLLLIAFTSLCSWVSGILMLKQRKRLVAAVNIVVNLMVLSIFKYYDFFVTEFARLFYVSSDGLLLRVVLPVGISFYTFQALSYTIDVYRGKIEPTKDLIAFCAFIAFFPQLVAGPIERSTRLLPQFLKKRTFDCDTAIDGLRQMVWGLFKKIVVADNCAIYVDQVFSDYPSHNGSTLLVAAFFFSFQIYGDFSGYSDMAIGTAKLFGIKLMRNFNVPYFSRDIAEFWRKWHISLTTWFKDYVYIPLGGSRVSKAKIVRNTFVVFLLCGLWHGANWTYVVWGAYNALLFLPLILTGRNRKHINTIAERRILPTWKEAGQILFTFLLVTLGMVLFRSADVHSFVGYLQRMVDAGLCSAPIKKKMVLDNGFFIAIMMVVEWTHREREHGLALHSNKFFVRFVLLFLLIEFILFFMATVPSPFLYFQF